MSTTVAVRSPSDTRDRILEAAFERARLVGLARTTVEDIARGAGLTRQTIYRYFPSKDHLVMALVLREEERFLDGAREAFMGARDLAQALRDGTKFFLRFARQHPLLDRLLQEDEGTLLPFLTVRAAPLIRRAREAVIELVKSKEWIRPDALHGAADATVRLMISYCLTPPDRPDETVAREVARILVPALTGKEANSV